MVRIEISDSVWERYKLSWALIDIREHRDLVKMLEGDLLCASDSVIEDAERHLMDDTPEAYARREIGFMKEEQERRQRKQKTLEEFR